MENIMKIGKLLMTMSIEIGIPLPDDTPVGPMNEPALAEQIAGEFKKQAIEQGATVKSFEVSMEVVEI